MRNWEKSRKIGGTVAAILTIGAMSLESYRTMPQQTPEVKVDNNLLESIFKTDVTELGEEIAGRARIDSLDSDIKPDYRVKEGMAITFMTVKESRIFRVIAYMKLKDGKPDPQTTYQIDAEKYFPNSRQLQYGSAILNPEVSPDIGVRGWYGEMGTFSADNRKKPDVLKTSGSDMKHNAARAKRISETTQNIIDEALKPAPLRDDQTSGNIS